MNISEAKAVVNKLEKFIIDLQLYDWNEIFESVPDSDEIKDEIEGLLDSSRGAITDLRDFFE